MGKLLIKNGTIVNEGQRFIGYIVVQGERITSIGQGEYVGSEDNFEVIDAVGKLVIAGVIDDQVHFREPGLTQKGDIHSESIAAVAGGITSYMEMPNTNPPAVTNRLVEDKFDIAAQKSVANYSFYLGATNDNIAEIERVDPKRICGIKLFMGSSTGNMLVDKENSLAAIFSSSAVLVAAHCEDEQTIKANIDYFTAQYGHSATAALHPLIRSAEACYKSSSKAAEMASKYGGRLHILHLSTARETTLLDQGRLEDKRITGEVCVHHLWFTEADYATKGNFIKWNPSIKSSADRDALRQAIASGRLDIVATDHAPHTLEEKQRPYCAAPSGGPLVQHSLVAMLELSKQEVFTLEQVVESMCHKPARLFAVKERGFLREGYFADIAIVQSNHSWQVGSGNILYKCGWSPFEGTTFSHAVTHTIINGAVAYVDGVVNGSLRGKALEFVR